MLESLAICTMMAILFIVILLFLNRVFGLEEEEENYNKPYYEELWVGEYTRFLTAEDLEKLNSDYFDYSVEGTIYKRSIPGKYEELWVQDESILDGDALAKVKCGYYDTTEKGTKYIKTDFVYENLQDNKC